MKEKDIRERIHIFLRTRFGTWWFPASMGIGLALVGCSDSGLNSNQDGATDSSIVQTGGAQMLYMAPMTGGATASAG